MLEAAVSEETEHLILSVRGVSVADLSGVHVLSHICDELKAKDMTIYFSCVQPQVSEMFQRCGLEEKITAAFGRTPDVEIIFYVGLCSGAGWVTPLGGKTVVLIGLEKIMELNWHDENSMLGLLYHELGHVATGALHKVDSPFELVERSEYRANRWSAETFLTETAFREAFAAGYTEIWQLSEYFDMPEDDVRKALHYWVDAQGIDFNRIETPGAR
jgi:ABC-type transporter Mla MlaB component